MLKQVPGWLLYANNCEIMKKAITVSMERGYFVADLFTFEQVSDLFVTQNIKHFDEATISSFIAFIKDHP